MSLGSQRCPGSGQWDKARPPSAHPGTAPGHGGVPSLPIFPPFSTTRFHASFCGLICTGMRLLGPRRPTGTPLCREGVGPASPVSPNTSVQINLLPPTPSPGFLGSLRVPAAPGGPWRGGTGGSGPRPHRFCAASYHLHPSNISGFGEPGWGGAGGGSRVRFGVHFSLLLFGRV